MIRPLLMLLLSLSTLPAMAVQQGLQLAQAQTKAATPAAKSTAAQQAPTCTRDGNPVADGNTWCRRGSLHVCNAAANQWNNTGKKCP